jgi:PTS system cellobiose-specific IIB component
MAKKIMLFCAAGMSTSLLVSKMKKEAQAQGKDYEISAYPESKYKELAPQADAILIGPQIRYALGKMKKEHPEYKVAAIPMQMYGMMDGKGVLALAEELMNEKK